PLEHLPPCITDARVCAARRKSFWTTQVSNPRALRIVLIAGPVALATRAVGRDILSGGGVLVDEGIEFVRGEGIDQDVAGGPGGVGICIRRVDAFDSEHGPGPTNV